MPVQSSEILIDNPHKLKFFYQQYWLEQQQAKYAVKKFLRLLALRRKRKRLLLIDELTNQENTKENILTNMSYTG